MVILSFLKYLRGIFDITLKAPSVHHAIIQSIYDAFVMVDGDLNLMRLEMCLSTATGKWLDHWGDFFNVYRKLNETDSAYSKRIIKSVIQPKTTIPAIKDHIVEFLNEKYHTKYTTADVDIKEPWKELSRYSHIGTLSHSTRFFSGDYYCHSVIDVSVPEALTQDLIDLVKAVKAAGVRIIWSFFNSYDIIMGYEEANEAWADYIHHVLLETYRNDQSGLILSHSSRYPTLSGHREIWFEIQTLYWWYAKMLDKNTDESIIITQKDIVEMMDQFEQIEQLFYTEDTGLKVSIDGLLSELKTLSGDATKTEIVTNLVHITDNMWKIIHTIDDWLTLSSKGKLSTTSGEMVKSGIAHELLSKVLEAANKFKQENLDYYNALQPPILNGERAQYLVPRHNGWLFSSPAMYQQDFYELWEMGTEDDTLQDIYNFEQLSEKRYLTFGDLYQPPIVVSDGPFYWHSKLDTPWLWESATLNNEELEEVYREKFGEHPELFPDIVTVIKVPQPNPINNFVLSDATQGHMPYNRIQVDVQETRHPETGFVLSQNSVISNRKTEYRTSIEVINHPENSFKLSDGGTISPCQYNLQISTVVHSEDNFVLSSSSLSNSFQLSGGDIEQRKDWIQNEQFTGYQKLSGDAPEIIKTITPIIYKELPLKFMSGGKIDRVINRTTILDDLGNNCKLSGEKSKYLERLEIEERVVTLGTLIDWEEQQPEVPYSTRYILQAPITITSQPI